MRADETVGYRADVCNLKPGDYSDVGQASVFAHEYGGNIRFAPETGWLFYDGKRWKESSLDVQACAQELTERQMIQAGEACNAAHARGIGAFQAEDSGERHAAEAEEKEAEKYLKFARSRRRTGAIAATLTEAKPMLQIPLDHLDRDPFLLNTPGGTVDLRSGRMRAHDPLDFCTKITTVSPDENGREIFDAFLDTLTVGDNELKAYLQTIAGMFALGAVFSECLTIAYGSGRNGKSTFFNLIGRVLGDYTGALSAETLTVNCRHNKSPEYAELRGKRFVIAAELEEGMRLDTAVVKKICSTDTILAEKKYRDPMQFRPSHSVLLFTNHLPKVGTNDAGTWRRLVVIPFCASITDDGDRKDFGDYIFRQAGGAALSWVVEGAKRFVEAGYKFDQPRCVREAIDDYRADNDWLQMFVAECCEKGPYQQSSSSLYARYQDFCLSNKEYCRSAVDFKRALEGAGYPYKRTRAGVSFQGLRLRQAGFEQTGERTPFEMTQTQLA